MDDQSTEIHKVRKSKSTALNADMPMRRHGALFSGARSCSQETAVYNRLS